MTASTYNFKSHIKGDTFSGVQFTITKNGVPLNLTGASARMDLRNSSGSLKKRFSTDPTIGGLTITDAAGGVLRFDAQVIDITPGECTYDIEFTFVDGSVKTYITGSWLIVKDITHDG